MIQETVASLPVPALKAIYELLMEAFYVEVPYSDPLEMAQAAVDRQKTCISKTLDLLDAHCPLLTPLPEEEPEP